MDCCCWWGCIIKSLSVPLGRKRRSSSTWSERASWLSAVSSAPLCVCVCAYVLSLSLELRSKKPHSQCQWKMWVVCVFESSSSSRSASEAKVKAKERARESERQRNDGHRGVNTQVKCVCFSWASLSPSVWRSTSTSANKEWERDDQHKRQQDKTTYKHTAPANDGDDNWRSSSWNRLAKRRRRAFVAEKAINNICTEDTLFQAEDTTTATTNMCTWRVSIIITTTTIAINSVDKSTA